MPHVTRVKGKPVYLNPAERREVAKGIAELIARRHPLIRLALLYGSFIKPERHFRDIDVAVHTLWKLSYEESLDLSQELEWDLEEHLASHHGLNLHVDVTVLDYAPPYIVVEATRGWLLVEKEPGLWALVAKWAHSRQEDHLRKLRLARELLGGDVQGESHEVREKAP